ncbi:MAG: YbaK/EbsC family protein [Candidatus Rokubacteria bacterium]|nr:YbaK/EbsC family protein [Candidatus Rokubacteria bacterium]
MNPRLSELFAREGVRHEVILHPGVYTAQERAAACHLTGRRLAKVVIVHDGAWYAMAVLPATARLDLQNLRRITRRWGLELAREEEFASLFPDCDLGAMPPFGRLYDGLSVYLDRSLAQADELTFEGGTHQEEVRIPMNAYIKIERPAIVPLGAARAA